MLALPCDKRQKAQTMQEHNNNDDDDGVGDAKTIIENTEKWRKENRLLLYNSDE